MKIILRSTSNLFKSIILLAFLITNSEMIAQLAKTESQQTPQELYDFHISKKKSNTAAAFITLGGGLAMIAGGAAINLDKCLLSDCQDGMALVYSGIGVGLSSIYFFNRAGKHKKTANIKLQNGAVGIGVRNANPIRRPAPCRSALWSRPHHKAQ